MASTTRLQITTSHKSPRFRSLEASAFSSGLGDPAAVGVGFTPSPTSTPTFRAAPSLHVSPTVLT